jgi:hypothetical protein
VNVPAVWNVNENCSPGPTTPEFHSRPSEVDVCSTTSVFVQVTVSPTETATASGTKAFDPRDCAPTGIEIDRDDDPGSGAGGGDDGDEGEEVLPQAAAKIKKADTAPTRNDNIESSKHERSKRSRSCLIRRHHLSHRFNE